MQAGDHVGVWMETSSGLRTSCLGGRGVSKEGANGVSLTLKDESSALGGEGKWAELRHEEGKNLEKPTRGRTAGP